MTTQSNIRIVMSDQYPPHLPGAYGSTDAQWPCPDRLSAGGVWFERIHQLHCQTANRADHVKGTEHYA